MRTHTHKNTFNIKNKQTNNNSFLQQKQTNRNQVDIIDDKKKYKTYFIMIIPY